MRSDGFQYCSVTGDVLCFLCFVQAAEPAAEENLMHVRLQRDPNN
jgi:hypothetical protein